MARAEVASASVNSDSIKGLAQSIAKPAYRRLLTAEPALRRAVPALIIAFLLTICVGAIVQVLDHRRQAISDIVKQIEAVADLLADRIDRLEQPKSDKRRPPAAGGARAHDAGLGADARPSGAGGERRRRDRRRHPPRDRRHCRRTGDRYRTARGRDRRAAADRRARPGPAADHVRRRGRGPGNPARRRQPGLRHGAQPVCVERRACDRAWTRRGAGLLGLRHGVDRHALRHHRLRRADPRLRLPLAGDARARGRRDLRYGALAHRYRAQPRTLRIVGLGPRPRPRVLVAFHVRDPGPQAARRTDELRRAQCPGPSRGYPSLRARGPTRRRQGHPGRPRLPHAPRQRQLGLAARALRAGPAARRRPARI